MPLSWYHLVELRGLRLRWDYGAFSEPFSPLRAAARVFASLDWGSFEHSDTMRRAGAG